jgi:hypothetical protein
MRNLCGAKTARHPATTPARHQAFTPARGNSLERLPHGAYDHSAHSNSATAKPAHTTKSALTVRKLLVARSRCPPPPIPENEMDKKSVNGVRTMPNAEITADRHANSGGQARRADHDQ